MAREKYKDWAPRDESLRVVEFANTIIEDYQKQRLTLTLRQLYYRFVAAGQLENSQKMYTRLGDIIGNARMAGMMDWDAIEDRGRNLYGRRHYDDPAEAIGSIVWQYGCNLWQHQSKYVEVWVEKQALESVIGNVASRWDCPYIACKGYMSLSEMYATACRFKRKYEAGLDCHIIHLGDHDPSGIDMTRDIRERIGKDFRAEVTVERIALNRDQVRKYNPPPNPAKLDDPRAKSYVEIHGESSWELDALEPRTLTQLIEDAIKRQLDLTIFEEMKRQQEVQRDDLRTLSRRYDEVCKYMKGQITIDSTTDEADEDYNDPSDEDDDLG